MLEYIFYRGWGYFGKGDVSFVIERFYLKIIVNLIDLYIGNLEFVDIVVYYCELRGIKRLLYRVVV